jgi:hypothetical protein
MSKMIKNTIEFLKAFDYSLEKENNSPIMNLVLEFMYIIFYFLLMPIWLTNLIYPVRNITIKPKIKRKVGEQK